MSRFRFRAAIALPASAALTLSAFVVPAVAAETVSSPVVINEIESNGDPVGDWVELANTSSTEDIDISGWKILDDNDEHAPVVIPEGTKIESGGYAAFYTEGEGNTPDKSEGFGLGGNDSVRIFNAEDELVAEHSWEGHSKTTIGRIPDMTGDFADTAKATRGLKNEAAEKAPEVKTEAWPYDDGLNVYDVDLGGDFSGEDMSGVDFDENGRVWVVNNGSGKLYALDYDEADKEYTLAGTWTLKYADDKDGVVDAEGVTVGPDGAIYVATERNNADKKVSRPSVLRFEVKEGAEELTATKEWNLKDVVGEIEANAGLEAISYIPEQKLFAVGVEANGKVYFLDLKEDGRHELKQEYQSPFAGVMALDYRQQDKQLRVLCDEVCDGQSILLAHNGDKFAPVSGIQARPAKMDNFANEGFGSFTTTGECVDGKAETTTRFLWADDGVTDGISMRGAESTKTDDCGDAGEPGDKGSGQSSSGSSTGAAIGAAVGIVLALIAGFLAVGPLSQWVKDTFNIDIKLPF